MKVLKVVFISIISLIILAIAGLFIFLKTVDLNKYIPQITAEASKALGRQVTMAGADIIFSFTKGFLLHVKDVSIADDARFRAAPFLTVSAIDVGFDVGQMILSRKIQLTQIRVNAPKIVLLRSKDGFINASSLSPAPAASKTTPPPSQATPAALPALLISSIKIVDAQVVYIDEMLSPRFELAVSKLDIDIDHFALNAPFDVSVKAAVFSLQQNLNLKAKVGLDIADSSVNISGLLAQLDLAYIDLAQLNNGVPSLMSLGLSKLEGVLSVRMPQVKAGAKGIDGLKALLAIDKASVAASVIPTPILNINMQADLDEKKIDVKSLQLEISDGKVKGGAVVLDYLTNPAVTGALKADGINVKKILEAYKLPLQLKGFFLGNGSFQFSGKSPEEIMASLNGGFEGNIRDGVIENVNLLAWGLDKIPLLPGLLNTILPDLSTASQEEVKQGITSLKTCQAKARLTGGVISLETGDLVTSDVSAHAQGNIDLKNGMEIKADVRIAKDISERLEHSVKKLASLNDDAGQIYIPVGVIGPVSKPSVVPDVEYLTKKMVVAVGGDALEKVLGTSEGAQAVDAIFGLFKKK